MAKLVILTGQWQRVFAEIDNRICYVHPYGKHCRAEICLMTLR
jgi:hypothetical protein